MRNGFGFQANPAGWPLCASNSLKARRRAMRLNRSLDTQVRPAASRPSLMWAGQLPTFGVRSAGPHASAISETRVHMPHSILRSEAIAFFDEFVTALQTFDGAFIARRYVAPFLAMHSDGSAGLFVETEEIGRYFQGVVGSYHQQGCRSCRYTNLEVVPLGERCALSTVTWELLREDGSVLIAWRESYNLLRGADGLRIFASVDHAV